MRAERLCNVFRFVCMLGVLVLSCNAPRNESPHVAERERTQRHQRWSVPRNADQSIERHLAEILEHVQPWLEHILPWPDYSTNYSKASWDGLILAAGAIQNSDPQVVEDALQNYQETHNRNQDDRKLLLLMRVAFDLPETRPREQWVGFGGWRDLSGSENMRTNAAWPISWNHGKPILIVGFTLFQGQRYDAAAEYRYFVGKYPARDLASFAR